MNSEVVEQSGSQTHLYLILLVFLLASIGLADSLYLTLSHGATELFCTLIEGCDVVLASKYGQFLGFPTATLGIVYYGLIMILSLVLLSRPQFLKFLVVSTILGFIVTLYFIYLQAFVLNAWCQYCLLSALTSTFLLVMSSYLWKRRS